MAKFEVGDLVRYEHPHMQVEDLHGSTGVITSVCPVELDDLQCYLIRWLSGPALTQMRFGPRTPFGEAVFQLEEISYDPTQQGDTEDDI